MSSQCHPRRTGARSALCAFALGAIALARPSVSQEVIRPRPHWPPPRPAPQPVRLAAIQIKARVVDGAAETEIRQTFCNDGGVDAEAEWILPLPDGACPDRFTMTVNGKDTAGEVLDSAHARQVYEDIVRRRRDPGLLEYFGSGCLRARVFPIAPRGESQVVVRYRHLLPASGGVSTWYFPLRAATAAGHPAERITLELTIESKVPLKSVYSPMPGVDVSRRGEGSARVSFESQKGQVPERDLSVYYGVSEQAFGLTLLSTKRPGEDGYFLMLVTPKQEWPEAGSPGRAITFVVDTSGSMQGQKMTQAKEALRFFLRSLRPQDLFNVVTFATEATPFFRAMQPVAKDALDQALAKVDALEAKGGTNIEDGLGQALGATLGNVDGRALLPIVVFLTDGQPTIATTDPEQLLQKVGQANKAAARIFVFGVGNDVNTRLLDKIAEKSRADRDYVREDEAIEVKTGALFTKLSHPVLTDVTLACDGIETRELLPKTLPDLFCGGRLVVMGRYRGDGARTIRLSGQVGGKRTEHVFEGTFAAGLGQHDFVPALWANARVGQLLDAIRLNGAQPELVEEVKRLGREFQIVTPYTSHLVLEDTMRIGRVWDTRGGASGPTTPGAAAPRVAEELRRAGVLPGDRGADDLEATLSKSRADAKESERKLADLPGLATGSEAVKASMAGKDAYSMLSVVPSASRAAAGEAATYGSRRIGERTFCLVGGVWVDAALRAEQREKAKKIAAFSDEYFALLRERPELGPAFAFSTRIVIVVGADAYDIE